MKEEPTEDKSKTAEKQLVRLELNYHEFHGPKYELLRAVICF